MSNHLHIPSHIAEMANYWSFAAYFRRYGIPSITIPNPEDPLPRPWPWPPDPFSYLQHRVRMHEFLLADIIGNLAWQDPSPQPSITEMLQDPQIRLESAEKLHQQLTDSLKALETELSVLKKQTADNANKEKEKTAGD